VKGVSLKHPWGKTTFFKRKKEFFVKKDKLNHSSIKEKCFKGTPSIVEGSSTTFDRVLK